MSSTSIRFNPGKRVIRQLIERNIAIDRGHDHVPREVLDYLTDCIRTLPQITAEHVLIGRIEDADMVWKTQKGAELLCRGPLLDTDIAHERLFRVTTAESLLYLREGPGNRAPNAREQQRLIEDLRNSATSNSLKHQFVGLLRGRRNVCWLTVTPQNVAAGTAAELADFALHLRDSLGLQHLPVNSHLVAMEFNPGFFNRLHVPTVLDGVTNLVYCSWITRPVPGGYAWHLRNHCRGAREFVTQDVSLRNRHLEFTLSYAGQLSNTSASPDWNKLLNDPR